MANNNIDQKGRLITFFKVCGTAVLVTLCIISWFSFYGYVLYYQATAPEPDLKQQPVRFTAKLSTTRNITHVDQEGFLTFPQFEQYNGYGLENFVKNFENGTIQIGSHDRINKAFQLFLTFNAESDWSATRRNSYVYVHHRSGQDGLVEIMKLPSLEGGDTIQVVSHSWTWTIFPGGKHKDQIWITVDAETAFFNYTLTAFDLPNKYHP